MDQTMFDRLCQAAIAADDQEGWTITRRDAESIVRAVLKELREPTDDMMIAAADSLGKRRMHVGHSGSDQVAGAITAYSAMIAAALSPTQEP